MAQKPKAPKWLIENITEASKNARKIYFLYIGLLTYCGVTVVGTSDRQIILNETVSLPILRLDVSLNGFFILSPLVAILVFIYLQLYLHRLKVLTDDLRTNYASIEKRRLYPWMINIANDPDPGPVGKLQSIIVKCSLWISLPLVLFLISIWFIKKHDPFSYILGISPIIGTFVVLFFWCHDEDTQMKDLFRRNLKAIFVYIGLIIASALLAFLASIGLAIILKTPPVVMPFLLFYLQVIGVCIVFFLLLRKLYLKWRSLPLKDEGKTILISSVLTIGVLLLSIIIPFSNNGSFISVDLSYQKLITEPKKDYEGLFWGNFSEAHLEGADLTNTVLERADLRNAHLQKATMSGAILRKANLEEAKLQEANLEEAKFQEAKLWGANLQGANLLGANLQGANLKNANLERANLGYAKGLTKNQLHEATNWIFAFYSKEQLVTLRLPETHTNNLFLKDFKGYDLKNLDLKYINLKGFSLLQADIRGINLEYANLQGANLQKANLWGANLRGADLRGTNLQGAELRQANLQEADLQGADLTAARNLTVEQLSKVKTLYEAKLDPELMGQIKKDYPHLLEKPKEDSWQSLSTQMKSSQSRD